MARSEERRTSTGFAGRGEARRRLLLPLLQETVARRVRRSPEGSLLLGEPKAPLGESWLDLGESWPPLGDR